MKDQKRSAERSGAEADAKPPAHDCSAEPLRPTVSNTDALPLMVETVLAADHTEDTAHHKRTLVIVELDPNKEVHSRTCSDGRPRRYRAGAAWR